MIIKKKKVDEILSIVKVSSLLFSAMAFYNTPLILQSLTINFSVL